MCSLFPWQHGISYLFIFFASETNSISCVHEKFVENLKLVWQLSKKKTIYRNSDYEMHQVDSKNARSQNLSFLAFEGEAVHKFAYNGA
jgi:hypothetical protein